MMTVVNKVRIFTALCYWNYVNIRLMVVTMYGSTSVRRAVAVLFIIALSPGNSIFFDVRVTAAFRTRTDQLMYGHGA